MASILVVDDEPDIRYLAQMALESDGHLVMTASDGDDALAAIEVEVPDVVLLDVMMPEVDGWTVLDRLKSHFDDRISTVRVIMVTSLGADMEKARGGVGGAIRYLVKPVDADDLLATVREVLAGAPEPEQRRQAQTGALTAIARIEKGMSPDTVDTEPRPRFAGLERMSRTAAGDGGDTPRRLVTGELTDTQLEILRVVSETDSVVNAAATLGVSRANIYASLRRSARTLGIDSVPDALDMLRSGTLVVAD
ncbi:response regulator transcription factor [Actinospongicola halichondriae]|uniref:response regulator transcription factor n=1 Tax=Actinospongicola halichondriae TaxID=3236844 RepID=UPI003D5CC2B5